MIRSLIFSHLKPFFLSRTVTLKVLIELRVDRCLLLRFLWMVLMAKVAALSLPLTVCTQYQNHKYHFLPVIAEIKVQMDLSLNRNKGTDFLLLEEIPLFSLRKPLAHSRWYHGV